MTGLSRSMSLNGAIKQCYSSSLRSCRFLSVIVICIVILITYLSSSFHFVGFYNPTRSFIRYRLRPQNISAFSFVQFRNIIKLKKACESMSTIDCLAYLNQNQSDYLQPLSFDDMRTFKETYCTKTKKMLFHTFWSDSHRLNHPTVHLHIQSFLYTQNRQCSHLIVWTMPPFDIRINHPYNMLYVSNVEFRSLMDVADDLLKVGTPIGPHWFKSPWRWLLNRRAQVGDAARFILLHKFGGMYVDVDTLFLRDMQPFFAHEFAYRWSIIDGFNTAVLRLFPQSNISSIIINHAWQVKSPYAFFPTSIHTYLLPANFYRLPCAFFDPIWLAVDGGDPKAQQEWKINGGTLESFKDPFLKQSEVSRRGLTVFDGAFTFHYHSSSVSAIFELGSYVHQWSQFLDIQVHDKFDAIELPVRKELRASPFIQTMI